MKEKLEKYRAKTGAFKTDPGTNYGLFYISSPTQPNLTLKVLCAPMNKEWQHVSVSLPKRCPNWPEMAKVKDLFWSDDETVVQYHPKKSEYVNNHPFCLHLWRKSGEDMELPPSILTGVKELGPEELKKIADEMGITMPGVDL